MKDKQLFRVIIPHYDQVEKLAACLATIPPMVETFVVKGSTYAYNCNAGARSETWKQPDGGRYIFLNDDCLLPENAIAFLTALVDGPGHVTGCKVVAAPGRESEKPILSGVYLRHQNGGLEVVLHDDLPVPREGYLSLPAGCCFAIDADVFHAQGGFDQGFINGWEDIDLFMRLLEKGYTLSCIQAAVLHHQESSGGRLDHVSENRTRFSKLWPDERLAKVFESTTVDV